MASSLAFFGPTLDFVISATDVTHDQIESLFEQLRRIPKDEDAQSGLRLARVRSTDNENGWHYGDNLIDIIMSNVEPTSWGEIGGSGSIATDEPRLARIVSQTVDIHDNGSHLLTILRRSRYAALRSDRPWEVDSTTGGPPMSLMALRGIETDLRLAQLPDPKPEEIAALEVRRVLDSVQWKWRRVAADNDTEETISVRHWTGSTNYLEIESPDCVISTGRTHTRSGGCRRSLLANRSSRPTARRQVLLGLQDMEPSEPILASHSGVREMSAVWQEAIDRRTVGVEQGI